MPSDDDQRSINIHINRLEITEEALERLALQKNTRAEVDAAKAASGQPPPTADEVAELKRQLAAMPKHYERSPDGSLHAAGAAPTPSPAQMRMAASIYGGLLALTAERSLNEGVEVPPGPGSAPTTTRCPSDAYQAVVAAMDGAWRTIRDATGKAPWQAHITSPGQAIAEMARILVQDRLCMLELAENAGIPAHEPLLLTTLGERIRRWRAVEEVRSNTVTRVHIADQVECIDGVRQAQVIDYAGHAWIYVDVTDGSTFAEVLPRIETRLRDILPATIAPHIVDLQQHAAPPEKLASSSVADLRGLMVECGIAFQRILRGYDRYPPDGLVHQIEVAACALGSGWKSSEVGRTALESRLLAQAQSLFGSNASVVQVGSSYRVRLRVNTDTVDSTVLEFQPPWLRDEALAPEAE